MKYLILTGFNLLFSWCFADRIISHTPASFSSIFKSPTVGTSPLECKIRNSVHQYRNYAENKSSYFNHEVNMLTALRYRSVKLNCPIVSGINNVDLKIVPLRNALGKPASTNINLLLKKTISNKNGVFNALNLNNVHDITISGKHFTGGKLPCINLTNCSNIHIIGNTFSNCTNVGVHLYKCKNVLIEDNFFTKVSSGVYAEQVSEGGIKVISNQFLNMIGPFPRGQFIQFNNVSGPGCLISHNKGENCLDQSYPEDAISLYQSKGTENSPIIIDGNWIRGGGPSASGGGIMLGDRGGSYLVAKNNVLVDPGEFGMAIAGGDHITITKNLIFGRSQYFTNVGLYINDIGGYQTTNCTISFNKVRYYNKNNYQNNAWIAPGTTKPDGWETNIFGYALNSSILPEKIVYEKVIVE